MSLLPLVTLELRTAARRKSTYRIRRWTAIIAFVVTLFFIAVGFFGGRQAGKDSFNLLTIYAVGLALIAGLFLTADCISEEKREGTLPLLFLTDLKGYDIVLGKFIARSLNAIYGLLALLPIAAISLLLGGLTGGEFWRTALALVNVLFVTLAIGIFVSALVREGRAATSTTLLSTLLISAGLPAIAWLLSQAHLPYWLTYPSYINPCYTFSWADDVIYRSHSATYWQSLAASHVFGWFLVAFASWALPKVWQEKSVVSEKRGILRRFFRQGRGTTAQRSKARERLLPINSILWLIGDEPTLRRILWGLVSIWAISITILSWQLRDEAVTAPLWGTKIFGFLFKIVFASQACRFFIESRKNGALELLLTTPLRNRDIIRGQWLALRRLFLWPLIIFGLFNLTPLAFIVGRAMAGPNIVEALKPIGSALGTLLVTLWFTAGLLADVFTIGWVGMWLALTVKKPDLAPAWTILFVLILPTIAVCGLDLLVDMFLILWASGNLQTDFRWTLARRFQLPSGRMTPRMALPYSSPPPIIAR